MKNIFVFFQVLFIISLFSCGDDDNGDGNDDNGNTANYMPIANGNTWSYDYSRTVNDTPQTGTVVTTMNGTQTVGGQAYNVWDDILQVIFGLDDVEDDFLLVRKSGNDYFQQGSIAFFGSDNTAPINIQYNDWKFLDEGLSVGTQINELGGSFSSAPMPINQNTGQGTFNGTITVVYKYYHQLTLTDIIGSGTINGTNYNDIFKTLSKYYLEVVLEFDGTVSAGTSSFTVDDSHTFIPQGAVGEGVLHYVNNIGIVRSDYFYTGDNLEPDYSAEIQVGPFTVPLDLTPFATGTGDALTSLSSNGVYELTSYTVQ